MSDIEVVFQDQDLLILNKPAGVVVNRAQTVRETTVQDWLETEIQVLTYPEAASWQSCIPTDFSDEYGSPEEIFHERSGIAHRLDKDTSGILVCARNPGSLMHLLDQFKSRTTSKTYSCLVHGRFSSMSGIIDAPLGRRSGNRFLYGIVANGKPAVTEYEVQAEYAGLNPDGLATIPKATHRLYETGFSFVTCRPKTGRTHQIRVHMAHVQHPLVGDHLYAGRKRSKVDPLWCERQFLHAASIEILHPRTGAPMLFTAPLTDDLSQVMQLLQPV